MKESYAPFKRVTFCCGLTEEVKAVPRALKKRVTFPEE